MQAYSNPVAMQNAGFYTQTQNPYNMLAPTYPSMTDGKSTLYILVLVNVQSDVGHVCE